MAAAATAAASMTAATATTAGAVAAPLLVLALGQYAGLECGQPLRHALYARQVDLAEEKTHTRTEIASQRFRKTTRSTRQQETQHEQRERVRTSTG